MRILCLTVGPDSEPSARFRVHQWLAPLAAQGIEVEVRPRSGRRWLEVGYGLRRLPAPARAVWAGARFAALLLRRLRDLSDAREFDLLWIQKETFPFGLERLLTPLGVRAVFDFDDAIWLRPAHGDAGLGRLRGVAERVVRRERALPRLLERSALVLAGNANLAAYAREHAGDVRIVPTVVDVERYPVRAVRRTGTLTIGWLGAPPNVAYLDPLRPVLRALSQRFALRLVVAGPGRYECADVRVECRPWRHYRSVEEEAAELADFDIGVMPLPDDRFAAGKCGLKAIQYMAAGIPVVASPVGVNSELIDDACGFLARTPEDWERSLSRLLASADLRERMGRAGRARVEARFSLGAQLPALVEALRAAARSAVPGKRISSAASTSPTAASS
jgi:glycosyltransferase involved in cell wall biosynthesis